MLACALGTCSIALQEGLLAVAMTNDQDIVRELFDHGADISGFDKVAAAVRLHSCVVRTHTDLACDDRFHSIDDSQGECAGNAKPISER